MGHRCYYGGNFTSRDFNTDAENKKCILFFIIWPWFIFPGGKFQRGYSCRSPFCSRRVWVLGSPQVLRGHLRFHLSRTFAFSAQWLYFEGCYYFHSTVEAWESLLGFQYHLSISEVHFSRQFCILTPLGPIDLSLLSKSVRNSFPCL